MEIQPIEIKSSGFFWMLQPWKDGKLATIDGWGRFAEIRFGRNNRISIHPLVNFPREQLENTFITWPEYNLLFTQQKKIIFIADTGTRLRRDAMPYFSGLYKSPVPVLLDPVEGLLNLSYTDMDKLHLYHRIIYNYKKDEVVYESEGDTDVAVQKPLGNGLAIARTLNNEDEPDYTHFFFCNPWTGEKTTNPLTEEMSKLNLVTMILRDSWGISLQKRYLIGTSEILKTMVKINWSEDFEDVSVTPLNYLFPEGKTVPSYNFLLSADGEWATSYIGGFRGIDGERLVKRAFLHMSERYPNGVSMLIFSINYERYDYDTGTFFTHPEYGVCFACEYNKNNELYLHLYKMSDVLNEINRQLLEKAQGVMSRN
jgi:hypothetical protein